MAIDWNKILEVAIPAGGQIGSTILQNRGAQGAANIQSQGAKDAMAVLAKIWAQQQQSLQPYQYAGQAGLAQLMRGLGIAPGPTTGGGAGGGQSAYTSPLSGTVGNGVQAPSALNSTGARALSGAATGAGIGSVVPGIGTAIGAGVGAGVGALSAQFGKGRHEADQLTPIQNEVAAQVDRITKAVDAAKADGTLTQADLNTAISTVKGLQSEFNTKAGEFGRAGPGGVATLEKYFAPMLADWQGQVASLPAGDSTTASGSERMPGSEDGGIGGIGFGEFNKTFGNEDFVKDPGYQFRMDEGLKGVQAHAGNMLHSGGTFKALERYGQGFASNEYDKAYGRFTNDQNTRFSRLMGVAGFGERANTQSILAGDTYAKGTTDLITDSASGQSAAKQVSANNWSDTLAFGANTLSDILKSKQKKDNLTASNASGYD